MSSIILHISDLHVSLAKKIGGELNSHDSYLDTSNNKENSLHFIDKFINTIKKDFENDKIYLLITGDITNSGEIKEFDFALNFLERIKSALKIDINNILLIPGDHDLNRRDITNLLVGKENSSNSEVNIEKYKNFRDFYFKLTNKEFDANKVIFDTIIVENSFMLLGLNSCTEIDLIQKLGSIPISKFEEEIKPLISSGKKIIACVHHNLTSSYDDKNSGQWKPENRQFFLDKLLNFSIEFIFTGNEHTNSCKTIFLGEITSSDSGCMTSIKNDSTFKVYPIIINDDIILQNRIYSLHKQNGNDSLYEWDIRTNKVFHQPENFTIFKKEPPFIEDEITEILTEKIEVTEEIKLSNSEMKSEEELKTIYYNPEYTDILYDKVKELHIYHSGHFHWSETSRAHNWIDVSNLIEDKDNLNFVKNAYIDVIENKISAENIDLIIGLGYEGNIVSTKAIIKYNKPYCFLPYSYRYHEHHEYETLMNFDNKDKKFKSVLVITDVVNDGRTIRKLIKKRQKDFFVNVDKIYVISLFYTGQSEICPNILNSDFVKNIPNYDFENDEDVNNIEFYTVKSLKVEKCPYGKNFREECLIVKDNLGCVNLFYDESKYI